MNSEKRLAIEGGEKTRTTPLPDGKKVGAEELKELTDVIESGQLFRWGGTKVIQFEKEFAELHGVKHAIASSSGTSSIHVALSMIDPAPGDEIITPPITDIGSILPIIYQNCIPIFADVQPDTYNLDPASVEANITEKTKAIMAIHLFGNPTEVNQHYTAAGLPLRTGRRGSSAWSIWRRMNLKKMQRSTFYWPLRRERGSCRGPGRDRPGRHAEPLGKATS